MTQPRVVLDTNILLDLWLYDDPATPALREALQTGAVQWLTTTVMREELARVLAYPHIVQRLAHEVKDLCDAGIQVGLVIGGGNILRGSEKASAGLNRVTGAQMGMLATQNNLINWFWILLISMLSNWGSEALKTPFLSHFAPLNSPT